MTRLLNLEISSSVCRQLQESIPRPILAIRLPLRICIVATLNHPPSPQSLVLKQYRWLNHSDSESSTGLCVVGIWLVCHRWVADLEIYNWFGCLAARIVMGGGGGVSRSNQPAERSGVPRATLGDGGGSKWRRQRRSASWGDGGGSKWRRGTDLSARSRLTWGRRGWDI